MNKQCEFCTKEFEIIGKKNKFCSAVCGKKSWRRKHYPPKNHEIKPCLFCRKEFKTNRKTSKYCSKLCLGRDWRKNNQNKMREHRKKYILNNKEKYNLSKKKSKHKNKLKNILTRYKITKEHFEYMLLIQEGRCDLCGIEFDEPMYPDGGIAIDHCHKTGKIRSLLHNYCNKLIGMAYEDCRLLEMAIKYLKKYAAIPGPVIYQYKDKIYTHATAAKEFGIRYDTLKRRLLAGWSFEKAIITPVDTKSWTIKNRKIN